MECGIEENIFTACNDCHKEHDEGKNQLAMQEKSKKYLICSFILYKKTHSVNNI